MLSIVIPTLARAHFLRQCLDDLDKIATEDCEVLVGLFDPEAGLTHLSAEGGSWAWGHIRRTVPMHYIVGNWYFLLRAIRDRTLGAHGLLLELRAIAIGLLKNPQVGRSPFIFLGNVGRAAWGFCIALIRLAHGPRRIQTLDAAAYREITAARVVK